MTIPDNIVKELEAIFVHATADELAHLRKNLCTLNGNVITKCVYGLLTGNCWSERGDALAKKCGGAKLNFLGRPNTELEIFIFEKAGEELVKNWLTEKFATL